MPSTGRGASFDDIVFLAAVEPRLTVLRTLTATVAPQNRQDLMAATGFSPARVDSTIGELNACEWVVETDEGYRGTPAGTVVVEGFTTMEATLETERRLRDVVEGLPTNAVDFDVRWLRDAEIVLPTESDPPVVVWRLADWVGAAERVQARSIPMVPPLIKAIRHATVRGEQRFETVLTPTAFAAVQEDATIAPLFVEILESKNAHVFVSEEDLSLRLAVVDDATVLVLTDDEGTLRAGIRSEDEAVCDWATTTFEAGRDAATRIDSDAFTP